MIIKFEVAGLLQMHPAFEVNIHFTFAIRAGKFRPAAEFDIPNNLICFRINCRSIIAAAVERKYSLGKRVINYCIRLLPVYFNSFNIS